MANGDDSGGLARTIAVVGALGGTATLVAVTGGLITWVRFHQAGLPADQAVAATPNTELVTVGAVALVTYGVIGLLAVLAAYAIDSEARATHGNKWSVVALAAAGALVALGFSEPTASEAALGGLVIAGAAVAVSLVVLHLLPVGGGSPQHPVIGGVVLAVTLGLTGFGLWKLSGEDWVGVMAVVAAGLGTALLAIALATGTTFRWFGLSVFLAVVIFGGVMATLRTASATKLQPIAVLLDKEAGNRGISGLYVTETSDRIYLADVDHCRREDLVLAPTDQPVAGTGRIIEVPRSSVTAAAIGTRQRLRAAEERGPQLLTELRIRQTDTVQSKVVVPDPCANEGVLDLTQRASEEVEPTHAAKLAARFRPVLKFDGSERWRPLNIARLLAERMPDGDPRHRVCVLTAAGKLDAHECEPVSSVEDLADEQSAARVLDLDGTALDGGDHRSPALADCPGTQPPGVLDCDRGPAAAMYYRVTKSGRRTYVDYWWFLRFNDFDKLSARDFCRRPVERALIGCFNHEGDWEGVTVVSAKGDDQKLAFVDMAAHEGVFRYAAREFEAEGTRPVVYSARGSHASYPDACSSGCTQPESRLPETNRTGAASWGANDDCPVGECLLPLPAKGFDAFTGRWGSPACAGNNCEFAAGPKSPSRQRRYLRPWCFTAPGGQLTCDGSYKPAAVTPPHPPSALRPATPAAP